MFTNELVKKEQKKRKKTLWIGLIFIGFAIIFIMIGGNMQTEAEKNKPSLNSVIISKDNDKSGKTAYMDVYYPPYKFAIRDDITDAYYIVSDKNYYYIVYMSEEDFNKLNKEDINENPIRITGVTALTTTDIKKLAIDAYNEAMDGEDNKITIADFDNYFGSVYLNTTSEAVESGGGLTVLGVFSFFIGVIMIIVYFVKKIVFKKTMKKIGESQIMLIDNEMNGKEAFYYPKAHLCLTDNYIINFGLKFDVIKYDDIIWLYSSTFRYNGIKTNQNIVVLTKDNKTHTIANIDVVTKKKKEAYDEIFNTIISKNKNIIVGYTKEAKLQAKEELKKYSRF